MIQSPEDVNIPKEVLDAAISGKLTIFFGNGLSRLYGYPSWGGLADSMLTELAKENVINFNDVELLKKLPIKTKISIADSYFKENWKLENKKNLKLTYEAVLNKTKNIKKLENEKIFSFLAKCKVKFITTNYDDLLDTQLNKVHKNPIRNTNLKKTDTEKEGFIEDTNSNGFEIISHPDKLSYNAITKQTILLHLHGTMGINEDKIIASTADYLKLYSDDDFIKRFVELIKDQTIIFIGYGLEELEVLEMLFRATDLTNSKRRHIILLPLMSHEQYLLKHLDQYWSNLGFSLLPYNSDKRGYDSIEDLILKWVPDIVDAAMPPLDTKNNAVIDNLLRLFDEASQ